MKRKQSTLPRKESNSFTEEVMLVLDFFFFKQGCVCQVEKKNYLNRRNNMSKGLAV